MNPILPHIRVFLLPLIAGFLLLLGISCGNSHNKEFDGVPDEQREFVGNNGYGGRRGENKAAPPAPLVKNQSAYDGMRRIAVRDIGPLRLVLNDSNAKQLDAARKIGVDPIEDIRGAYRTKRPLVKIESCGNYEVDNLRHSLPFLVPEAAKLLNDIGREFNDSLKARGGDGYRIKVTSMLRTPHTVKKLRRVNINATETSTHQFATTFDISYTKFHKYGEEAEIHDGDLKNLLAEILNNMRLKGRCYVKFERQTSCFHITCR